MSNSLDPDQARHFVGPDLDQNCLQRLSANDTGRQVKHQDKNLFLAIFFLFKEMELKVTFLDLFCHLMAIFRNSLT